MYFPIFFWDTTELDVDFATKTVHGFVKHVAAVLQQGVDELVLDTRDVVVDRVVLCSDDNTEVPLAFTFGNTHKVCIICLHGLLFVPTPNMYR